MEKELKYALVDRAAYDALAAALGAEKSSIEQTNYYYDNVDGVVRQGGTSAVRVRSERQGEATHWELTYKFGRSQQGAYFQAEELNESLSLEAAGKLLAGDWSEVWETLPLRKFAELFGTRPMVQLGRMRNQRRCFDLDGEKVELDLTDFPDGSIDYEVEVETERPEVVAAALAEVAARAGIELRPQGSTKFGRFLTRAGLR